MAARTDEPNETGLSLATVRRTLAVLEMLANAGSGLSLSEIARCLDVNKSIALRILMTLEEENYVFRHIETKHYFAGLKISNLGLRVLSRNRLISQIQPVIRQLAEECGELVLFSVLDHGEPRWVMAAAGRRQMLQVDPVTPMTPHATATGKAWLSTLTDEEATKVLKGRLEPMTPHTVTTMDVLLDQLAQVRRTGLAFSDQERELGIVAVATPIWSPASAGGGEDRRCIGFVSITAPVSRVTRDDFDRLGNMVRGCATRLGEAWPLPEADGYPAVMGGMPHGLVL
jgi:DNA-binding IclR family transcriptional regulator